MSKNKIIQKIRMLTAVIVAILCIAGFLNLFYPIKIFNINLIPLLERTFIDFSIFTLVFLGFIIILTLIFGRIYCSTICPLGLFQELCLLLLPRKKIPSQKNYPHKYIIAALAFGTLLGGTTFIIRLIDPYSVFGSALSGTIYGLIFITAVALLTWLKGRFFCTNLCPAGTLLGLISRHAYNKITINPDVCVACGLCAQKCPAGCIDYKNKTINNETCIKCFKCLTLCHNHGITYTHPQKNKKTPFNPERRRFLAGVAACALLATAYKSSIILSQTIIKKIKQIVVPAGAVSPERMANKCLNCNLCIQHCPMKIIKPANKDFPVAHIEYGKNFCRFDCRKCSEVCPSGAIQRLTLKEKQKTQIALASVNEDVCIQCGLCVMECPRHAISKPQGEFPIITPDSCIGCGACQAVCPVSAIKVTAIPQQKTLAS